MSNVRELVNIIDNLEKQSENLTSALDMYNEIKKLNKQINETSEKYDKVVKDINKMKIKLLESIDETSNILNQSSENINISLQENRIYVENLKNDIEKTTKKLDEVNDLYLKLDDGLKNNGKNIEKYLNNICWKINNDLENTQKNIKVNLDSIGTSFSNISKEIKSNNDKIIELKLYLKSNLDSQNIELKRCIIEEMQKVQVNLNNQIINMEKDNEKNIKNQYVLFMVIICLLIGNLLVNLIIK